MAVRTVRLSSEDEEMLREIRRQTGLGASAVLRHGLLALQRSLVLESSYEVYRRLGLGRGTGALGPAAKAKQSVREEIRRKAEVERNWRPESRTTRKTRARAAGR